VGTAPNRRPQRRLSPGGNAAILHSRTYALRHQLTVLKRQAKKPQLEDRDRLFWIGMKRFWAGFRGALHLVQPATVVGWHSAGFRYYWRRKSKPGGRPKIDPEIRKLIREMWNANPTWGKPRIQSELAKLGIRVSDSTVARYKPTRRKPPSLFAVLCSLMSFGQGHVRGEQARPFPTTPDLTQWEVGANLCWDGLHFRFSLSG
jgi:hypothetical protein